LGTTNEIEPADENVCVLGTTAFAPSRIGFIMPGSMLANSAKAAYNNAKRRQLVN
jgi:hypothetical protein